MQFPRVLLQDSLEQLATLQPPPLQPISHLKLPPSQTSEGRVNCRPEPEGRHLVVVVVSMKCKRRDVDGTLLSRMLLFKNSSVSCNMSSNDALDKNG